jgi:hypothetical protein
MTSKNDTFNHEVNRANQDSRADIVDKISTDVTNYLKNKNIPYITTTTSPSLSMNIAPPPGPVNSSETTCDCDIIATCCDGAVKMETVHITHPVNCISDLLYLCDTYKLAENVVYNIDMRSLHNIYPHLLELNEMIGMTAIKQTIVDQIMYFIQQLHLIRATPGNDPGAGSATKLPPVCSSRRVTSPNPKPANTSSTLKGSGNQNAASTTATATATATTTTTTTTAPTTPLFNFGGGSTASDGSLFSIFGFKIPAFGIGYDAESGASDAGASNGSPEDPVAPSNSNRNSGGSIGGNGGSNGGMGGVNIFKFPLFKTSTLPATKSASGSKRRNVSGDYMHTVLYGPPGTGKTEVAKILGNIFCNLGVLKSNTFKKVTRSDLVAGYLGQTAIKTREVIESAIGGVLFIDEAYALGNTEKRDSFSKECIDTLCEALSDHKHELMVIIAGYEKELNDCFFSYNEGLSSRFTWRYKIDSYDAVELRKIFEKIVSDNKWTFHERDSVKDEWFKAKQPYFKYFGRDIEVFFTKTKIAHGRRAFYLSAKDRRKLTIKDLDAGFELFSNTDEIKGRGQQLAGPAATMYL